jgi:Ribose/xylose/arabinose/galactoside ABC-type transport systems, permease components
MSESDTKKKTNVFSWFRNMWMTNLLFSTGMALIVMIVLQTLALGFNYDSVGTWFGTWLQNWINILRNNAGIGIIALGMTFVIISGGIDLAVGSTLVAIGAVLMMLIDTGPLGILQRMGIIGVPAYIFAIILGIIFGIILGEVTGLLVTRGKLPPFIATLGTMKNLPQCHPAFHARLYTCGSQTLFKHRKHQCRWSVAHANHILAHPGGCPIYRVHPHLLWAAGNCRGLQRTRHETFGCECKRHQTQGLRFNGIPGQPFRCDPGFPYRFDGLCQRRQRL